SSHELANLIKDRMVQHACTDVVERRNARQAVAHELLRQHSARAEARAVRPPLACHEAIWVLDHAKNAATYMSGPVVHRLQLRVNRVRGAPDPIFDRSHVHRVRPKGGLQVGEDLVRSMVTSVASGTRRAIRNERYTRLQSQPTFIRFHVPTLAPA